MGIILQKVYSFLPIQLLLLHFRKYQLMLLFWLILFLTLSGNFATTFGADSLFLAPEYLGQINMMSMFLLGAATAIFMMSWNITTFIIHSQRIPFLGATRHSFLKYCINNALLPLIYLLFFTIVSVRFQIDNENTKPLRILLLQLGFYLGIITVLLISFVYFFRVDKDLFKIVLSRITNPSLIREFVPYDSLDEDYDVIRADTYVSSNLRIGKVKDLKSYHPRLMNIVLRMHHRNAITATFFSLLLLIILGIFFNEPRLRIPAGAGFLILFSIIMGLVGAMKHFLKTWELMGWIMIGAIISILVKYSLFNIGSKAFGLDYHTGYHPAYQYDSFRTMLNSGVYEKDINQEQQRLTNWLEKNQDSTNSKPPLVVIAVSGGGTRSAYWTLRSLQYLDSLTQGQLFRHSVLISGASGGMIGATYWQSIHTGVLKGSIQKAYSTKYLDNVGKDLLNAIIFSFASLDIISPFNKIAISGKSYNRDRGYAMEQELIRNTEGVLDKRIGDDKLLIEKGDVPNFVINSTIVNDGRKLMISPIPISYLMMPTYGRNDTTTPIDAIDFTALFKYQNALYLRLPTALRMNATFPYVLPAVKLPSNPEIDVMDAGLRDNFGIELISRYLLIHKDWMQEHVGNIILLQLRDTKENEVFPFSQEKSLSSLLTEPLFVIHNKWEPFQSYTQSYIKEVLPQINNHIHTVTLTYIPDIPDKSAALNFHITQREKADLYKSIDHPQNQAQVQQFLKLMQH